MAKLHLDTDNGGDIDDLCALAMLLKWPGLELTGITTVADHNGIRAGYAKYVLAIAGREDIPVAAGADVSLGCYRFKPGYPKEEDNWPEPISRPPDERRRCCNHILFLGRAPQLTRMAEAAKWATT